MCIRDRISTARSRISGTSGSPRPPSLPARSGLLSAGRQTARLVERDVHPHLVLATRREVTAIRRGDCHIVDACFTTSHQAIGVELPELVAITTKPVARAVMPFVLETHGDAAVSYTHL